MFNHMVDEELIISAKISSYWIIFPGILSSPNLDVVAWIGC